PGHVSRRRHPLHHQRAHRHRHPDLRHPPRAARSAHPAGGRMSDARTVHMIAAEEDAPRGAPVLVAAATLPQWRLVWRRLLRHRLAMVGLAVTAFIYLVVVFGGFIAPYSSDRYSPGHSFAPPQTLHVSVAGGLSVYVHPWISKRDPITFQRSWFE